MTSFTNDNGESLDYTGEDFGLTKQIFSIFDMSIKGDISINFSIPASSKNKNLLGYYGIRQISNGAFSKHAFTIVRNGNTITKGYIVIQRDLGKTLDCFFLAGNANWFDAFKFNCRQIVNADYSVRWNAPNIISLSGQRSGICFPIVDWAFGGLRYGPEFFTGTILQGTTGADISVKLYDVYPCLFLHTLMDELCRIADIRLAGDLLLDGLYKSLIVTPSGPDLIDPVSQTTPTPSMSSSISLGDFITIGMIAPDMDAIDVIKWVIVSFGCLATYDIYSKVLTLNLSSKKQKNSASDWSAYLKDSILEYDKVSQHNYIRVRQGNEDGVVQYNQTNDVQFGELDMQSDKDDGSENELYSSPFLSAKDLVGTTNLQLGAPFVQLFKLTDGEGYAYTSVNNNGGLAQFVGAAFPFTGGAANVVYRVSGSVYTGYHYVPAIGSATSTTVNSTSAFVSTDSGTIYVQRISKVNSGPRILICAPATDLNFFSAKSTFSIGSSAASATNLSYAYYSKVANTFADDPFRKSLSYGDINLRFYYGITMAESYYNLIKKWLTSAYVRAKFLLPESEFQKFVFDPVYLNTTNLSGYFMVGRIYAYKGTKDLVEVELYRID